MHPAPTSHALCAGALSLAALSVALLTPAAESRLPEELPPPAAVGASVGGPVSPTGAPLQCKLPAERHRKNTASRGLGLCVFTSIHHAADLQNVQALVEFPKYLIDKGVAGGGYPQKVDDLIKRMCKDRGVDVPDYLQVRNMDTNILQLACKTGRMVSVTYGYSPTGRYRGSRVAHMTNLVHALNGEYCILDNNYIGENAYEWMDEKTFLRVYKEGSDTGWAVILLGPRKSPAPRSR